MRKLDNKFNLDVRGYPGTGIQIVIVNAVSGQEIPEDEPLFLLRARDHHAYGALMHYLALCAEDCNELHVEGIKQQIREFIDFATNYPNRMKQPGVSKDLRLRETS